MCLHVDTRPSLPGRPLPARLEQSRCRRSRRLPAVATRRDRPAPLPLIFQAVRAVSLSPSQCLQSRIVLVCYTL